jgi:hypothetical protein
MAANLQSEQRIRILDIISEGQVAGLKNGWQSVYLDGTPLQNPDGSFNAENVQAWFRSGTNRQDPIPDSDGIESETTVGVELKYGQSVIRSITNTDVTSVRFTVAVGQLYQQDKASGEFNGAVVDLAVDIQNNGGGFVQVATVNFNGKAMSKFPKELKITLPLGGPWDIRVRRLTPDSTDPYLANPTSWDSYTQIVEQRLWLPYSAYASLDLPARAYQSIPRRVYNLLGRRVLVPSNYDPPTASYAGVWDGSFKDAYTNNPAWVFMDMLLNVRYGLGQFIGLTSVDKWALYSISQYCDGLVPDGRGGSERRFTCNVVLTSQQEAYDLLADMASCFRGILYSELGSLRAVADMPSDPVATFTQANVIDGKFTYSGSDYRSRHTVALVGWNDPGGLGQSRIAYVEDREGIQRFGLIETQTAGFGCTSESMATRVGKWMLYTERMETETVTFETNAEGVYVYPGAVIQVSDRIHAGERRAGRVASVVDQSTLMLDAPVPFKAGIAYTLGVVMGDGTMERHELMAQDGPAQMVRIADSAWQGTVREGALWLVTSADLVPTTWRVTSVVESEEGRVQVSALAYSPNRYAEIEYGIKLPEGDTSNVSLRPDPIRNLRIMEELYLVTANTVGERVNLSWESPEPRFVVRFRRNNENWTEMTSTAPNVNIPASPGAYDFEITAVNAIGVRSIPVLRSYSVVGRTAPPADVVAFGLQPISDIGLFTWNANTELDVIVGGRFEIRYSPDLTGVVWAAAIPVMVSVPGSAVSVELPLRAGTYLIKAQDSMGNYSINPAIIITTYAGVTDHRVVWQDCDQPEFDGHRVNLEFREDINSLIIGTVGNEWDLMTEDVVPGGMDAWQDVDVLQVAPEGYKSGTYYMENTLDLGGTFTTRLTVYMRAFPYVEGQGFFDDRMTDMDTWPDFDAVEGDADASAKVYVRQTDDPPEGWTDEGGTYHPAEWSDWQPFTIGNYRGRAFQFKVEMFAAIGSNIALNELCVVGDLSEKNAHGNDIAYTGAKMHIAFAPVVFFYIPSIGITIQNGATGDYISVTNKTTEGFDLEVFKADGSQAIGRSFDWIAMGA